MNLLRKLPTNLSKNLVSKNRFFFCQDLNDNKKIEITQENAHEIIDKVNLS